MGIQPSKLMGIQRWANKVLGMHDTITAQSFDKAVMTFGVWADNKLGERDKDGNPIHSLNELLGIDDQRSREETNKAGVQFLKLLAGTPGAIRFRRLN